MTFDEIAAGGDGVALAGGERIFVPLTAPGDVAEIDYAGTRGTLITIVEPGPARVAPPCPHYGNCGGCALQHVSAEFYRSWKRERVVAALKAAGLGETRVNETIETSAAARRRATFAVRKHGKDFSLGFNARRSSEISAIDGCLILHPDIAARLGALSALAARLGGASFDLAVTLCDNGLDIDAQGKIAPPSMTETSALLSALKEAGGVRLSINGEAIVELAPPVVSVDGVPMSPSPGAFLQASREGERALISLVAGAAKGAKKIADLFSGCGTFSLPLAKSATVSAFDSDKRAIAALQNAARAAQAAGLNPLKAEARDLFERPLSAKELKNFDAMVFDPPRAGAKDQAAEIAASGVSEIIAVSCNPATFARDAAIIVNKGYSLEEVTPVDQFVYSSHIELAALLVKRK